MCDYSLYEFPNRLAQEREELVVYRFPSGAIGLASAHDVRNAKPDFRDSKPGILAGLKQFLMPRRHFAAVCAVCVPPGARLRLRDIPAGLQRAFGLALEETGVFRELSANAHTYRDALEFRNGRHVVLQELSEGQRVEVLSLAGAEERFAPAEEQYSPAEKQYSSDAAATLARN